MSVFPARYRAARGWADLTQGDLAERLGLEKQAIVRTEAGRRDPKKGELIAVAAVCGVPEQFMLEGFGEIARDELRDRLERIESALDAAPPRAGDGVDGAVTPSVTERARAAAQRLAGTPAASPGTGGAQDVGGEAT